MGQMLLPGWAVSEPGSGWASHACWLVNNKAGGDLQKKKKKGRREPERRTGGYADEKEGVERKKGKAESEGGEFFSEGRGWVFFF